MISPSLKTDNDLPTAEPIILPARVTVRLDEQLVEIPAECAQSLAAARGFLERLALGAGRIVVIFSADVVGSAASIAGGETKSFRSIQATTVSLTEFSCSVTAEIDTRLAAMEAAVERASLLVMINDRWFACRCWRTWLGTLRGMLAQLNFLGELSAPSAEASCEAGNSLVLHVEALHMMNALAGVILAERPAGWSAHEAAAFSTLCDQHFLVWLKRLRGLLAELRES